MVIPFVVKLVILTVLSNAFGIVKIEVGDHGNLGCGSRENQKLLKYFLFSPRAPAEMIQFDLSIFFQMGW